MCDNDFTINSKLFMYKRSKGVRYICLETETEKLSNARIILEDADGIFNLETG